MNAAFVVPVLVNSKSTGAGETREHSLRDLDPSDSAVCALTDFRFAHTFTIGPDRPIGDALNDMEHWGVHALLVTVEDIDRLEHRVVGLITQYEIERKRPRRFPGSFHPPTKGLRVLDVMTPWIELPLVHYDSLTDLTAADLLDSFEGTGLTHLLVIETRVDDSAVARGVISRAALTRGLHRRRARWG